MGRVVIESSTRCNIYTNQDVRQFRRTQAGDLTAALKRIDNHTTLRGLDNADELQLRPDGTTKGGYRFTYHAFSQAAQMLAPGLVTLVPDLAGMASSKREVSDAKAAIALWNHLVDMRFGYFGNRRVMRNEENKTIEGFLGHKYKYLENLALFREASEMLSMYSDSRFYAGLLVGRRLCLWFRSERPMFRTEVGGRDSPFYHGHYFANGESTGTSVKGTISIYTPWGTCLGNFKRFGKQISHTGKNFTQRLGQMFATVCETEMPIDDLRRGAAQLNKSLGFAPKWTKEQIKNRRQEIVTALSLFHINKPLATEITDRALTIGRAQGKPTGLVSEISRLYAGRTIIDLFVPLLAAARSVAIEQREKHEQAAYEVLVGSSTLL